MDPAEMLNLADVLAWNTGIFHIAVYAIVMSVIVFVHELGHYCAGRWLGAKIVAFSLGIGHELAHLMDRRGTRWRIALWPIGGYVRFATRDDLTPDPATLAGAGFMTELALWRRALIIAAGPLANFILAFVLFSGHLYVLGRPHREPLIQTVIVGSAAEQAGLKAGDRVLAIDGAAIAEWLDIRAKIIGSGGQALTFAVRAPDAAPREVVVHPSLGAIGAPYVGISSPTGMQGVFYTPVSASEAAFHGVDMVWAITQGMGHFLGEAFTGRADMRQLQGPPGVAKALGETARTQPVQIFIIAAVISTSIGLFNLLPVPVLDGGFLMLFLIEAVFRRPVPQRIQAHAFRAGFAAIAMLMIFAIGNDFVAIIKSYGLM